MEKIASRLLVFLLSALLISSWIPISHSAKKPTSIARKPDIPYIKCQVCEKLTTELYKQVQKKQAQTSPKKLYFKQEYKEVAQFKDKGLEDRELLQSLFEGRFSTGDNRFTPVSELTEATQERDEVNNVVDDAFNDQGLDQMPDTYFTDYLFDMSPVNLGGPHSDAGSSKLPGRHRKREVEKDLILKIMGELMGYIKRQTLGDGQTTDEAMAQLDELRDLGQITHKEVENALVVFLFNRVR